MVPQIYFAFISSQGVVLLGDVALLEMVWSCYMKRLNVEAEFEVSYMLKPCAVCLFTSR